MPRQNVLLVSDSDRVANTNAQNNAFSITLNTPFTIPYQARNVTISCTSANIVNFFYNISTALGNNIIYYTDNVSLPQKYTITLPNGAYDFTNVNAVLKTYFITNGIDISTLKFFAQDYTQKISIAVKSGYGVQFPAGIARILGYPDNSTYFNAGATVLYYDATSTAKFNTIISLNLNCNLASSCFYNGLYSNLLATIPITASVGRIINYTPYVPVKIDANHLVGSYVNTISLQLSDQQNRSIIIAEEWNACITIEWEE